MDNFPLSILHCALLLHCGTAQGHATHVTVVPPQQVRVIEAGGRAVVWGLAPARCSAVQRDGHRLMPSDARAPALLPQCILGWRINRWRGLGVTYQNSKRAG